MTIEKSPERVKIRFSDNQGRQESLAASPVAEGRYKLEESPAFAYSVSAEDVFRAVPDSEGNLEFAEVVQKSGNRTVRIIFSRFGLDSQDAKPILRKLESLGCKCETSGTFLLTLMVPPQAALEDVVEYLLKLGLWWEHADPIYDDLYQGSGSTP